MSTSAKPLTVQDVIRRIGDTNERALAYVRDPDPSLARLPRAQREELVSELPAVTAGALLGPAALARHFVASAASGRYRDLFALWDLFRTHPDSCRPVLADRPQALEKGREALRTAVLLGLRGQAERVADDVRNAEGLIWQWLREILGAHQYAVAARPAVASALLLREPALDLPLPDRPDERWLREAAAAAAEHDLAKPVEVLLAAGVDRLPATVATLQLAHARFPDRVAGLLERLDPAADTAAAMASWARQHGHADWLARRAAAELVDAAGTGRAEALAAWRRWNELGVVADVPESVMNGGLQGLDLTRPETADLAAMLVGSGAAVDVQAAVEELAAENRQRAEKAYEAFVCAGLPVTLPKALEGNPIVKDGTRCPRCLAWTWVRPGHEQRCPRPPAEGVGDGVAEDAAVTNAAPAATTDAPTHATTDDGERSDASDTHPTTGPTGGPAS